MPVCAYPVRHNDVKRDGPLEDRDRRSSLQPVLGLGPRRRVRRDLYGIAFHVVTYDMRESKLLAN